MAAVRDGLCAFNRTRVGDDDDQPLAIFVRDDQRTIVGGLTGATFWGWLPVGLLWIREDLRGKGFGSRLLDAAEQEAFPRGPRGCTRVHLDTLAFRAPGFYQKRGHALYGELPEFVGGHARYYLTKRLRPARA